MTATAPTTKPPSRTRLGREATAMSETLTHWTTPRPSRLGGFLWFGLMVGGWMCFLALMLFSEPTLGGLRDAVRDLPLLVEGLVWLALFPFALALTVWDSSWETWLRGLHVASFAVGWSLAFYPWRRRMRVLVAAASGHGATYEIAEEIGRALEAHGIAADVRRVEDVDEYDAAVLGSAIDAGKWLEPAQRFVERHAAEAFRPAEGRHPRLERDPRRRGRDRRCDDQPG